MLPACPLTGSKHVRSAENRKALAMSIKLFMRPESFATRPACLFFAEKHLTVTEHVVDLLLGELHQPAYHALDPNRVVPVLENGDFRMAESSAILKYRAARFDAPEYQRDLRERARLDSMMNWFNTGPHQDLGHGLVYPQILPNRKRPTDDQSAGTVACGNDTARTLLGELNNHTLRSNDYVANNRISIAD
jgi:glutathione S-transferase